MLLCTSVSSFHLPTGSKSYKSSQLRETAAAGSELISEEAPKVVAKKVALPAKWLPIGGVKAPLILDGTLAGDVGFDPLGFAKSSKTLYWMREAEVKHGRLAMLAAVGW